VRRFGGERVYVALFGERLASARRAPKHARRHGIVHACQQPQEPAVVEQAHRSEVRIPRRAASVALRCRGGGLEVHGVAMAKGGIHAVVEEQWCGRAARRQR